MYFSEIKIKNFRNYKEQKLSFNKGLNLFLGENAQGKTNLLESLFVMSLGKSFRTNNDKDLIGFSSEFAKVCSCVIDPDLNRETEIEITYKNEGKIIKVNGLKLQRTADLLENVYIVVFSPEDLKIIKDGPESRRRFLDRELCQINKVYYSDLGNYKKLIKQRNTLLRENNRDKNLYGVFNESIADYGLRIIQERRKFIEKLQLISQDIHGKISGGRENIKIVYETKIKDKESYINQLENNFENDLYKGYTSLGPHKDDLKIEINDIDIRNFGSQGQQRTAALSMKLAEINLIKEETGNYPVLLLDDVLSELDQNRQRFLIEAMADIQVFITATEIDKELLELLPKGYIFNVSKGEANLLT